MRWRASEIAAVTDGELVGPDVDVDEVRHDSREVAGGELFVPVVDRRDGHDFIPAALEAGAAAYLTAGAPVGGTAVAVADTVAALDALARHSRSKLPGRVVAITGSVGKTSTKDLAAAALGRHWYTSASLRSFNNEIGVPLTVCNAPDGTEALVVEMGARGLGHVAGLCRLARPTVGIVTAVEHVHTELFGDLTTVARAKGELVESLPAGGIAVLNGAYPLVAAMRDRAGGGVDVHTYAADPGPVEGEIDVWAEAVVVDADLRPRFRLRSPWGSAEVHLAVRGAHHVGNALAALTAALACDVPFDDALAGVAEAGLSPWRMDLQRSETGALVLNDAYNAGPASVESALRSLAHLEAARRVAVLGPMAELGHHEIEAHERIAALARELGVRVIAVGAPAYGPAAEHVVDRDAALAALGPVGDGDAVLVKGSRMAGLEQVAHALIGG